MDTNMNFKKWKKPKNNMTDFKVDNTKVMYYNNARLIEM